MPLPSAPRLVLYVAAAVVGASLALLLASGPGYAAGYLSLPRAFLLLRIGAWGGVAGGLLALTSLLWRRMLTPATWLMLGLTLAGAAVAWAVPARWARVGRTVPPIHDITTDTEDPPQFVAVLSHRAGARNPPAYAGPASAVLQRKAYPDVVPIELAQPRARVHAAAREVINDSGWLLVGEDEREGRLEATATTRWFGFKDDIVVRLRDLPAGGTRVDVRSKSRIGRSDLGTNARRIRGFLRDLQQRLGPEA